MRAAAMPFAALVLFALCTAAHAQYPDKPLRLVVGFTAGGPTDLPARFIAERLGAELGKLTGTEMVGVPYKGGADALNDVLAGRVQLYVSPTLAVLPPYKAGRVRLLAVSSPERLAAAPEIPTLVEKGLPFVRFGWLGICVGSGTPQPIVSLLNRHVVTVVQSAEYREMAEKA